MTDNYEQLRQCYGCNGYRGCDLYVPNTTPLCVWKETLQADMEKLKNGEGCLTFPILEQIIKDEIRQGE